MAHEIEGLFSLEIALIGPTPSWLGPVIEAS